jgi:hypothetical protein
MQADELELPDRVLPPLVDGLVGSVGGQVGETSKLAILQPMLAVIGNALHGATISVHANASKRSPITLFQIGVRVSGTGKVCTRYMRYTPAIISRVLLETLIKMRRL